LDDLEGQLQPVRLAIVTTAGLLIVSWTTQKI